MIQQKSDNGIVPQDIRKSVVTDEETQKGGKAVAAEQRYSQLELHFTTAENEEQNSKLVAARDVGQPTSQTSAGPKVKEEIKENKPTTMDTVCSHLRAAFHRVTANKGAPGPDKQTVIEVKRNLNTILPKLERELKEGRYKPGEIRRVYIPKPGGGQRGLGIPNVIDRVVQEAIRISLEPLFEPTFHPNSHGFRPGKSCHTAINQAIKYLEKGFEWVVDIDLEKFFDTVCHQRLLDKLEKSIKDKRLLNLIHKLLKVGVIMPDGVVIEIKEGVPQGGPLSPLLSNIVLDELDKEMAQRGHRFVRYADDINIYVKSQRAGERVLEGLTRYIEKRLRLKVNKDKSSVDKPENRHFLGFSLMRDPLEGEVKVLLSNRSIKRIFQRIKELTPRGGNLSFAIMKLNQYLAGWLNFFKICSTRNNFSFADAHIRPRLRAMIFKQWKRKRTAARKLIKLGIKRETAWRRIYAGRRNIWALSLDYVAHRGLPNAYFKKLGLFSLERKWLEYKGLKP